MAATGNNRKTYCISLFPVLARNQCLKIPLALSAAVVVQEGLVQVAKFNSTDEMHVYLIRALLANLLDSQLAALLLFSTCSCRYCSDYVDLLPGFLSVVLL